MISYAYTATAEETSSHCYRTTKRLTKKSLISNPSTEEARQASSSRADLSPLL